MIQTGQLSLWQHLLEAWGVVPPPPAAVARDRSLDTIAAGSPRAVPEGPSSPSSSSCRDTAAEAVGVRGLIRQDITVNHRGDHQDRVTGPRILLPYLTTADRLRLALCCEQLKLYRENLGAIRISRWYEPLRPADRVDRRLRTCNSCTQAGILDNFRGCFRANLKVLQSTSSSPWRTPTPSSSAISWRQVHWRPWRSSALGALLENSVSAGTVGRIPSPLPMKWRLSMDCVTSSSP